MRHTLPGTMLALALAFALSCLSGVRAAEPSAARSAQVTAAESAERRGDWPGAVDRLTAILDDQSLPADLRIKALRERAEALLQMGFVEKSIADLTAAIGLAKDRTDVAQQIALRGTLGSVYVTAGKIQPAEEELGAALSLARDAGDRYAQSVTELNLGTLHSITAPSSAEPELRSVAARAAALGASLVSAKASIGAGRLAVKRGDVAAARRDLVQAWQSLPREPSTHDEAFTLIAAAQLERALATQVPRRAYDAFDATQKWARQAGDGRALSYALGYMAQLYAAQGRTKDAQDLINGALAAVEDLYAPEIVYLWHWQTGRLLRDAGDIEGAIGAYRRAISALQSIRSDMTLDMLGGRLSLREVVGPIFLEAADLLVRHAPGETAASQEHLREARETLETLKGAELQDYFADDCIASLQERVKPIDSLAADTVALYPIVLPDRLELILSVGKDLRQQTVLVRGDDVRRTVANFRSLLEKRTTNEYLTPSQQLYTWIIKPFADILASPKITTLVIVPDDVFRTIPLAALHDGTHFLMERYALAVTPGLTLMDPRHLPRQNVRVLVGGLTEKIRDYDPLPRVAQEVDDIHKDYDASLLVNESFRTASIRDALKSTPYTIVHFASHGEFLADSRQSFILTYDGKLTMDALEQDVKYARFREDPVELLTLSACDTAAGDDRAALGLAGVAIKAGARSAVATLWPVNDGASAALMSDFYARLKDAGKTKAEALREAQSDLLSDSQYDHPYYWAPFLMIGNWL